MSATPFDDWLHSQVRPMLLAHGYRGTRRRFTRQTEAGCAVIEFQRSRSSTDGRSRFLASIGVWNRHVAEATGETGRGCPPVGRCHLNRRVGEWWEIDHTLETGTEGVTRDVHDRLTKEVLPFLDVVGTDAGLAAVWADDPWAMQFLHLLSPRDARSRDIQQR